MQTKSCVLLSSLTIAGLLFLVIGLTMHWKGPTVVHNEIAKAVALLNGSEAFENWLNPPAPVFIEFYMFNLTNAEAVMHEGATPKLQQIGPYTYRVLRLKSDLEFSDDETYLSFRVNKYTIFNRSMSAGSENDTFIGLNIPMLTVSTMLQYELSMTMQFALNMFLTANGVRLFNKYQVGEYLWGYSDPFFAMSKSWLQKFGQDDMANRIPDVLGLFTGPKGNGTNDGLWKVHTGKGDASKLNQIQSWDGNTSIAWWNSEWANMINGTDASMWHPFVQKDEKLFMFASDICRSGSITFEKEIPHHSLTLYRFTLSSNILASAEENPQNADFCTPPGNCLKGGLLNMSVCSNGAPIMLSQPHFTGAHKDYQNGVEGMRPSPDLQTSLDVDPMTGTVLHGRKLLQFNAYITPLETFPDTLEMKPTVYPMLWVNETGGLSKEGARMFKDKVYGPGFYIAIASYAAMGIGAALLLLVATLILCLVVKKTRKEEMAVVFKNQNETKQVSSGHDPASSVALVKKEAELQQKAHEDKHLVVSYVAVVEQMPDHYPRNHVV